LKALANWPRIEAIAKALLERRALSGAEVRRDSGVT
jgi:hypothetical protein